MVAYTKRQFKFDSKEIHMDVSITKPKKAKKAELRKRWVRYLAHTLNLISQAFLFGQDPEKFLMNTGWSFESLDREPSGVLPR